MLKIVRYEDFLNESVTEFKMGDSGPEVRDLQNDLRKLGFKLGDFKTDGKFGPETLATALAAEGQIDAIHGLNVGPIPKRTVPAAVVKKIEGASTNSEISHKVSENLEKIRRQLEREGLAFKERLVRLPDIKTFLPRLKEVAKEIRVPRNWLLTVMFKESRINPFAVNKTSGASGLIQWAVNTAEGLGHSIERVRQMSATQQLDLVQKYLAGRRYKSLYDLYLQVFYPAAVNKKNSFVIGSERSEDWAKTIANQNPAIAQGKEKITVGMFKKYVLQNIDQENLSVIQKSLHQTI